MPMATATDIKSAHICTREACKVHSSKPWKTGSHGGWHLLPRKAPPVIQCMFILHERKPPGTTPLGYCSLNVDVVFP